MTVPDSFRIAFSFTALSLTGCTTALAVIRKHGRASRVGHGIVTLITAALAAVSIYSAQSHEPIDGFINSFLCAAIGASPFIKFKTLNEALEPSGVLQPYLSICINFALVLIGLKFVVVVMLMTDSYTQTFTSILFLSVALEYIILGAITFYLQRLAVQQSGSAFKRAAQQMYFWSVALASFASSVSGFRSQDMELLIWLLWSLLLLILLCQCLLLAYEATKTIRSQRGAIQVTPKKTVWWKSSSNGTQSRSTFNGGESAQEYGGNTFIGNTERRSGRQDTASTIMAGSADPLETTHHGQDAGSEAAYHPRLKITEQQKRDLHLILETGDALQIQQLVRIGFPGVDAYEILKERIQKRQDDCEIWAHLGYKEERRKPSWYRIFQRCSICKPLFLFSPHETFVCGHLICKCKDDSCCPSCGPEFEQLWEFLARERPAPPKIEWPLVPHSLVDETEAHNFAKSVVQKHKLAFQEITMEDLVSFALIGSPKGVTSFLESHKDLAKKVGEIREDGAKMWAWHEASKERHRFELLSQAIQIGLQGKAEEWNVLNLSENDLHTKTLSPIRTMFERYSTSEFLERVPLLSRTLARAWTETT
ncbi:hypothetical protein B0J12DRAFT_660020 [Macrophomina phaseolina]|uniref:RING-type domain-containing protein n=1 Tax=Macrophomina phaseolina TaxID=35725 RepID=A0ABQ8GEU8_9PEZI|nr:hypothetical protein B0J12DRAFT_660020 [Macrophomina phaseolina]